jgi:hypothetical protein
MNAFSGGKVAMLGINGIFINTLWEVSQRSPLVASIIELAATWATASPWHVEVELRRQDLSAAKTSYTDDQLNRVMAVQLENSLEIAIKHTLIFGFFVVRYRLAEGAKRNDLQAEDVRPVVLHPHEYELRYVLRKDGSKKWAAYTRGMIAGAEAKPIPQTRVFMFEQPEPISGRPNSALLRCLRPIYQYDTLIANAEIVSTKLAFPPFVYNNKSVVLPMPDNADQSKALGKGDPGEFLPDGTDTGDLHFQAEQTELLANMLLKNRSLRLAKNIHDRASMLDNMPDQMDQLSAHTKDYIDDYVRTATTNPTMPSKLLANGIELEKNTPHPETLKQFSELEEILKSQISILLGVPVEMIFPQRGRFSADVLLSKKIMSIRTSRLHTWLAQIIKAVFFDVHHDYVASLVRSIAETRALKELSDLSTGIGADAFRRVGLALRDKYTRALQKLLIVNVHFDANTTASETALLQAFETYAIDHQTYTRLLLSSQGLAHSLQATYDEKERAVIEKTLRGNRLKRSASASSENPEQQAQRQRVGAKDLDEMEQ